MARENAEEWIDDVIKRMHEDEVADRIEQSSIAKPIDYARSRGIAPQKVYRAIRIGKLTKIHCPCGALCVDKDAADTLFGYKEVDEDGH
jgi:hypothetical protein